MTCCGLAIFQNYDILNLNLKVIHQFLSYFLGFFSFLISWNFLSSSTQAAVINKQYICTCLVRYIKYHSTIVFAVLLPELYTVVIIHL